MSSTIKPSLNSQNNSLHPGEKKSIIPSQNRQRNLSSSFRNNARLQLCSEKVSLHGTQIHPINVRGIIRKSRALFRSSRINHICIAVTWEPKENTRVYSAGASSLTPVSHVLNKYAQCTGCKFTFGYFTWAWGL